MSFKHWFRRALVLIMVMGLASFVVYASDWVFVAGADELPVSSSLDDTYLSSNQFTQADDLSVVDNFLNVPVSYILVGDNAYYSLYMEEGSYAIRILNKADGFIYGSSISTKDQDLEYFNTTWEGIVNSAVTIKYYSYNDTTGVYTSIEESFLKSASSSSTYELVDNGFLAHLYFGDSGISLDLLVYLSDNALVVEIPNDSIQDGETYKLRSIKTYPFLGAVFGDSIPGYIFVPDGSGALIRYQAIDVQTDIYEFRYFGQDDAVQTAISNQAVLSFPVSGMVQGINQHGFLAIVEDGAAHASLVVSPAKNNLKYYYTYNEFLYRSLYQTPLSESQAASGTGRLVIEDAINSCNVTLKYVFLSGNDANYVGMANTYRDYLISESLLSDHVSTEDGMSIYLDVLGAETKPGFLFQETLSMTTFSELSAILSDLAAEGVLSTVVYEGFQKGGVSSSPLVVTGLETKLGSASELQSLIQTAQDLGIDLYFAIDPMQVYDNAKFNIYQDIARRINQNLFAVEGIIKTSYFATPSRVASAYLENVQKLHQMGIDQVAVMTVGSTLYSDHTDTLNPTDRSEAIAAYVEMMQNAPSQVLVAPNVYLLAFTEKYLLMPLTTHRYRIYTDSVPFASYVLASYMEAYAPYANFASASRVELLRMVDYGVRPSYILTEQSAYLLQDTELAQIYSSSYSTWKDRIQSDVAFVEAGFLATTNAQVLSRVYLDSGVYLVTYSNGVHLYINYNNYAVDILGQTLDAVSYRVVM